MGTGAECNFRIEELLIKVVNDNDFPTPYSSFTAPDTHSTACAKTGLSVVASGVGYTYFYKWSASSDPKADELETFVSKIIASQFLVPIDRLHRKIFSWL